VAGNTSGGTTPALGLLSSGSWHQRGGTVRRSCINSTAGAHHDAGNNTVINTIRAARSRPCRSTPAAQYAAVNVKHALRQHHAGRHQRTRGAASTSRPRRLNAVDQHRRRQRRHRHQRQQHQQLRRLRHLPQLKRQRQRRQHHQRQPATSCLRGDSVGTSDAIALGGSGISTNSVNNISSQGGNITLVGNFHSPNVPELDHGIAILGVTNRIQTTGSGNVTLIGNAADQGDGVSFYSSGNALVSVENGALSVTGSSVYGDGVSILTGTNALRATGSGSVTVTGTSTNAGGITIYPSTNASSTIISTNTGKLTLDGTSGSASSSAGITIRSPSSGAAAGVNILSNSGAIALNGTAKGSGDGIAFVGSSTNGFNTISTGGSAGMTLNVSSNGAAGIRLDGGTNKLKVVDGCSCWSTSTRPTASAFSAVRRRHHLCRHRQRRGDATTSAAASATT
jgi:hypothetical protein